MQSQYRSWRSELCSQSRLWSVLSLILAFFLLIGPQVSAASPEEASRSEARISSELIPNPESHVLGPGESLPQLALRYGVPLRRLMRENGIRHPAEVRPGQRIRIGSPDGQAGIYHTLESDEDLLWLARLTGNGPKALARRNGWLLPTGQPVGQQVWRPLPVPMGADGIALSVQVAPDVPITPLAPRTAAAVHWGVGLWQVLRLNPLPHMSVPVMVPDLRMYGADTHVDRAVGLGLPAPVTGVRLSPQPVRRGETVAVAVTTSQPVSCAVRAFDAIENCVGTDPRHWYALIGLSPLLAPGRHTVTLELMTLEGPSVTLPLVLLVNAGRYDYERIILPVDRQPLLNPHLSQQERITIAAMRTVRSTERLWDYPFQSPIEMQVTSYFGARRSYGSGFTSYHAGVDFDGEIGMPVSAPAAGEVVLAESLVVRGNAVLVDHGWGIVSGFWHLDEIDVVVGQRIGRGERVGKVGNTGLSTGPHIHWELWVNGIAVNPLTWLKYDPLEPSLEALLGHLAE